MPTEKSIAKFTGGIVHGRKPYSFSFVIAFCMVYVLLILPTIKKHVGEKIKICHSIDSDTLNLFQLSSIQGGILNRSEEKEALERHVNNRFYLYRLIGNNMPPLQCFGQLLRNTRYTLDHEPPLEDCKKLWVLNNIVNATERALILDLLLSRGYTLEDILIRRVNFTKIYELPRESWTNAVTDSIVTDKVGNALVAGAAQNEARNFIIRHGQLSGARWILAFDGNQFYTTESWRAITAAAVRYDEMGLKYFKVPMFRLYSEQKAAWLHHGSQFHSIRRYAPVLWESQIAFRNDSDQLYSEGMIYGKDNKLDLLDRLCGTGVMKPHATLPVDTGKCGCHSELGSDRKQREINEKVALSCGYSIRLWYHPCAGVNGTRIFQDKVYRAKLRDKGLRSLSDSVVAGVSEAIRNRRNNVRD